MTTIDRIRLIGILAAGVRLGPLGPPGPGQVTGLPGQPLLPGAGEPVALPAEADLAADVRMGVHGALPPARTGPMLRLLVDRLPWPGGGGQRPEYPFRRGSPEGYYYPGGFTRRELRMGR